MPDDVDVKLGTVKLRGWQVLVVIVVLLGFLGYRITSMGAGTDDEKLIEKVKDQLTMDYRSEGTAAVKKLYEEGDDEALSRAIKSLSEPNIEIESAKTSYSIFDFSTSRREVVVKVIYLFDGPEGEREKNTRYYLYEYLPIGGAWHYVRETEKMRFIMNYL